MGKWTRVFASCALDAAYRNGRECFLVTTLGGGPNADIYFNSLSLGGCVSKPVFWCQQEFGTEGNNDCSLERTPGSSKEQI